MFNCVFYFTKLTSTATIISVVGGYISGNAMSYPYPATSIPAFLEPENVLQFMKAPGYTNTKATLLTDGIAYIYEGTK